MRSKTTGNLLARHPQELPTVAVFACGQLVI